MGMRGPYGTGYNGVCGAIDPLGNSMPRMFTFGEFMGHAIHGHKYMSGVDRSAGRIKKYAEVFTPNTLVLEVLAKIQARDNSAFYGQKTFLDPACGDGQFLVWVMVMKLTSGNLSLLQDVEFAKQDVTKEYALQLGTLYGVDIQRDNVDTTKKRLCMAVEHMLILDKNIRCGNSLEYNFNFD